MLKIYKSSKGRWQLPFGVAMLVFLVSFTPERALSQTKTIRGTVTESPTNIPLPGVSVRVKGTQTGTTTSANGNYTIMAKPTDVIVFTFLGLKTQEITVGTKTTINVALAGDATSLSEVVVIGYGTVAKPDLTGSVGVVPVDDMAKAPVGSFADALAGRVAGVKVNATDGQPGSSPNIVIRGAGSLTQSTSPLYVIDGFPVEDPDPEAINPEEIESMTILKDASSTAIYGSRGANGVILITTKRGKVGKPVVTVSSSLGFQSAPEPVELMSPYEFVKYQTELNPNVSTTLAYFGFDKTLGRQRTLEDYRSIEGVNFQDHVLRTGAQQIHNIALRGGTEQTRYSVSGSIFDQKGTIINTGLDRYNGRVNIDQTISNKIKAGVSGNYSGVTQWGQIINQGPLTTGNPTSMVFARTWMYRPVAPLLTDNLLTDLADDESTTSSDHRINPFIDLENQHQYNRTNILDGNAYVTFDITKDLQFKSNAGIRHKRIDQEYFFNSKTSQGSLTNPGNTNGINGRVRSYLDKSFSNENTLNYKKTINNDHTITALGLFAINSFNRTVNGYGGRLLPNENLGIDGLDEGVAFNPISSATVNRMASYAARLDYNYKSKYILTGTFRADGSSKFVDHWGYFPGAALAWNMHKEGFFAKAFPAVSTSKIRASYGSNGNNRVGDFATYPSLNQVLDGYAFNSSAPIGAIYVSAVGNPGLQWEKVNTMDLGYELGLFKDRITLEADLYRKSTENLLLNAILPPSTGFGSAVKNIGKLRNDGMEFTVNSVNISNRDFSWESNVNISFNKNKVMALTRGQQSLPTNATYVSQFNRPLYLAEIGKSAGMMIGYIWEGNYQYSDFDETSPGVYVLKPGVPTNGNARNVIQPGDIKYRDLDKDGTVDDSDITFIGRGTPIHTGGFANNFSYKGLSLNVFLQWSYGNDIYNANRLLLEGNSNGYALINQFASYANRWSPENQTNANYRTRGQGPIGKHSSRVVEDGSYLRLKTISLNYSIPTRFIKRAYLSNLSLNVAAQNLATWTNYSGMDPDVSARNNVLSPGYDYSSYPNSPTIAFGLKASF
ncbi:MAG TPA: TonB-dependent receptor [Sphingobacteriaceae bacterium]